MKQCDANHSSLGIRSRNLTRTVRATDIVVLYPLIFLRESGLWAPLKESAAEGDVEWQDRNTNVLFTPLLKVHALCFSRPEMLITPNFKMVHCGVVGWD